MSRKILLKRLFCRHKKIQYWAVKEEMRISPYITVQVRCKKCGKLIIIEHLTNEEFYTRFGVKFKY